jgi:hypothetical protein
MPLASPSPSPVDRAITDTRTIDNPDYWDDGLVNNVTEKDGGGNAFARIGIEWEQDADGNPRVHIQWATNSKAILTNSNCL